MPWPPSVVFLDRDGVLIEDVPTYVRKWDDVQIFPRAIEAIAILASQKIPMVVISNQSSVGRGIQSLEHVEALHGRILAEIEIRAKAQFLASYLCPHAPGDDCDCRKPKPGMLLQAGAEHGLDLARAVLVGDSLTDVQAADAAGVRGVLVRTGNGAKAESDLLAAGLSRAVFDDLLTAVAAQFESPIAS